LSWIEERKKKFPTAQAAQQKVFATSLGYDHVSCTPGHPRIFTLIVCLGCRKKSMKPKWLAERSSRRIRASAVALVMEMMMVEGILGHVVEDAGVGLEVALIVEVTAGEVVVISRIAEAGVEGGEGVITVRVIRATIIRPPSRIPA